VARLCCFEIDVKPQPRPQLPAPASEGELLELLLEATTDGVMDWDLALDTIRYTDRWKLLLGYESQTLAESPTLWRELSHADDLPRVEEALKEHLENFWPFTHTWRMKHANGVWRWVLCRAVTARDGAGQPLRVVAVFSDITDRIRAEERHRALISAIPDLLLRVQVDGTVVDVKAPDGQVAPGLSWPVAGQPLSAWPAAQDWHERITAGIGKQQPDASGLAVTLSAGANRRFGEARVVSSGEDEVVCIVRDVTEQRNLQAQLMQAHKLESIGQLAAGIAHEINTPMQFIGDNLSFVNDACATFMTIIRAQAQALQLAGQRVLTAEELAELAELEDDQDLGYMMEKVPRSVETAREGVKRVAGIVSAMKEFSHPGKTEKSSCDLNKEIETTITISSNAWKYVADVERQFDPELPRVLCHPGEINQVVLNLIVNAAHAIGDRGSEGTAEKGRITISTRLSGGFAEILVCDTGTGIPERVRDRIFDPFFTTKEVGRGTGQGLAIARNTVVERHGGTLHFETEMGKGTTFFVRLPLAPGSGTSDGSAA
jgi:PAS domain S-box-containing protein